MFIPKSLGRTISGITLPGGANYGKYFLPANVHVNPTNTITLDDTSPFSTGQGVQVGVSGAGTLPAPFIAFTNYFVIVINSTTVQLATTANNAMNGVPIVITTQGTGQLTFVGTIGPHPLASYLGQDTHIQSSAELAIHLHSLAPNATLLGTQTSGGGGPIAAVVAQYTAPPALDANIIQGTTNNSGSNSPATLIQPTTYAAYIMKL